MVPRNISFDPEIVTPAIAARDAILSEEESKAIKLWQNQAMSYVPSPHRLDARTTSGESFRAVPVELPPPSSQRLSYTPNPHRLDGRTTTADAFQAPPAAAPPPLSPRQTYQPSPHRFEARSVTHDDYQQNPVQPPPPSQRLSYTPNPHRLDGRTTTGESFKAIAIPAGVQALGVRTQRNGFHALIPSGSYAPARGAAVFTTTHDGQETVSIKVLALTAGPRGEERVPLGSFELAGIPSALAGVPQLLVSFELDDAMVLRVTAEDRTRANVRASITIRDRLPTPERERPAAA